MNIRKRFHFVLIVALCLATTTMDLFAQGAIVPISASTLSTPPAIGPELPPEPAMSFPMSAGLIDATIQQSDAEFKAEILRHTHPHIHKDYNELHEDMVKRITRLEVRINEVIDVLNKLRPMITGMLQREAIRDQTVRNMQQKVTDYESRFLPSMKRIDKVMNESECLRSQLDWFHDYFHKNMRGIPWPECDR